MTDDSLVAEDAPTDLVRFAQAKFDDRLTAGLREVGGKNVTETALVAHLERGDPVAQAAIDVFSAVEDRHFEWVAADHAYRSGFERRLRSAFGAGLDWFETFIELCEQAARGLYDRGAVGHTPRVMLDLHARACLTAREVHALLSSGFPGGALAAWRTTHKIAVYLTLLGEWGAQEDERLVRRWLAFADVERLRDAEVFQERAPGLGYEPIHERVMSSLRERSDSALGEWGRTLRRSNGWASEITAPKPPQFSTLEDLAELGHLRGHYRWASHRVHADGRGNENNLFVRGGEAVRLAGPSNTGGFVDVADLVLGSLHVSTNSLLLNSRAGGAEPGEAVVVRLLQLVRDKTVGLFDEGERIVDEAERLVAEEGAAEPLETVSEWSAATRHL